MSTRYRPCSSAWALPLILSFQAAASLILLHNTAFEDEALYIFAGRQIIDHWRDKSASVEPFGSYFSGIPSIHPVIVGALDMAGGLEAARMFSLLCMLGVTSCVFWMTKNLRDRKAAILAAALYSCQAAVLFLGRLATHDSLCLLLLSLAAAMAVRGGISRTLWGAWLIGSLLALAVATKYAGLLFVPTILGLFLWRSFRAFGWDKMLRQTGAVMSALVLAFLIVFELGGKEALPGLALTTLFRVISSHTTTSNMLGRITVWGGGIYSLAFIGLVLNGLQDLAAGLLLFASSLLIPIYHVSRGEMVSLHKHMAFALFFAAPLAGCALEQLVGHSRSKLISYRIGLGAAVSSILLLGLWQAHSFYLSWASSTAMVRMLTTEINKGNDRYLAEDFNVSRFYLRDMTNPWQWTSLDYFTYTDESNHQHAGKDAYEVAIAEGYFDLVELSFGPRAAMARTIDQELRASNRYELIAKEAYSDAYGAGYFWLWLKKGACDAAHGR
jgi:hypothetical protein